MGMKAMVGLMVGLGVAAASAQGTGAGPAAGKPWMNPTLTADQRADLVLHEMTLAEKLQMIHGTGWGVLRRGDPVPERSNHGAGFVEGIPRLGIPDINEADSAVGVRMSAPDSRYATLLPSVVGLAASWDEKAAHLYGEVIGRELKAQGFNMSIGGGVDIMREPRNGRNFEYAGEEPVLAGRMVGQLALGVQSQHVMGDIKHYALNDQETGRSVVDVKMTKKVMRETDLLAFQIAIEMSDPAGVMCSYNLVNGDHACENDYLLNQVLKKDFGFKGFVLSDWEATHSTVKAANAGLDQEEPGEQYFGPALAKAVADGQVPMARLDDMNRRILRSLFASGTVDDPPVRKVVDPFKGKDDAQRIEEESLVLLKNNAGVLPLKAAGTRKIVLIGGHADVGVLSGGGSAQVDAPGGNAVGQHEGSAMWGTPVYFPSSPMRAIQKLMPGATVSYLDGKDSGAAAAAAKDADAVIVFATQYTMEGRDSATMTLPEGQDGLIAAVAAANPRTVVVLETGGPVAMPWADKVGAAMESWYPGIGGGEAIANVLFGVVNPSGKLPATFAVDETQLPLPKIAGMTAGTRGGGADGSGREKGFTMSYPEGVAVGYRWFQEKKLTPRYSFGHGLSYTSYRYGGLQTAGRTVTFTVTNTGAVAGTEVAQVYVTLPAAAGEEFARLGGWQRVALAAGETKTVSVALDPALLSVYDEGTGWKLLEGQYRVGVGPASDAVVLKGDVSLR